MTSINKDFFLEVTKGNVPGHRAIHKFGRNPDIDTASGFETLWNGGSTYTGHNATEAEIVEVFSSSAADASAGTGARVLRLFGLNSNYDEITEDVTLNGITPVNTTKKFLRLDRMRVVSAGTGGSNDGSLTARQSVTTANVFAVMPIGYNSTMIAAYTIPANYEGFLVHWFVSLNKKQAAFSDARMRIRPLGQVFQVNEEVTIGTTGNSFIDRDFPLPKNNLPPKADIFIEANADVNDVGVSGGFDLILFKVS